MKIVEKISAVDPTRRNVALMASGLALGALLSGSGDTSHAKPRAEVEKRWDTDQYGDLVFDGRINLDGANWSLNCYANQGLREATAEAGDTLLSLAHKAGTLLVHSPKLGQEDVPADVYAVALADINQLPNQDLIIAGQDYSFPESCRLG